MDFATSQLEQRDMWGISDCPLAVGEEGGRKDRMVGRKEEGEREGRRRER